MAEKILAVHNGGHHPDDVIGAAALRGVFGAFKIERTRDPERVAAAWAAVDVGGVDDAQALRFDHHQKGFARKRPDGTPLASSGLVWAEFGVDFVKSRCEAPLDDAQAKAVAESVDFELIRHVDAEDSGFDIPSKGRCGISAAIDAFNPTWLESDGLDKAGRDALAAERFDEAVAAALEILDRACAVAAAKVLAESVVDAAERALGGRLMVLERPGLPWTERIVAVDPKLLLTMYPDSSDGQWQVTVVPKQMGSFEARMDLPAEWAGLRFEDLAAVCGVADAVFCHNGRFICGAKSKAGAMELARLALSAGGVEP